MGFNPLKEKGTPIEKQIRNWSELNVQPYDKASVHPYTRTRVILMNGIEVEGAMFGHQFLRHCTDPDLNRTVAMSRRVEQQQQKVINWLTPGDESTLEVTLGYEQVAVDLTAWLARTEPDTYVKAALDFALIEDFDHLYRYSNLLEMTEGKKPDATTRDLTEIMPGRPTIKEHRHPFDSIRRHYDRDTAQPITKLHVMTIVAAEQQTMNFYMNVGNQSATEVGRGLDQEIAMIEEQHVSHYGSLMDPAQTWFEMLMMHEYNECYMYYSCLQSETDKRIKGIWEQHLSQELEHLKIACDLMRKYEKRDPESMLPAELPELTIFQPNKEYVRKVLASQVDLTADLTKFVPEESLDHNHRYFMYQSMVNKDSMVPSQEVIEQMILEKGRDYRQETDGPHPVERLRTRQRAAA